MKLLKVQRMGEAVQGVKLYGDPARQLEPIHFRTMFPGGDVDVVRTTNDEYWLHFRVNRAQDVVDGAGVRGRLVDARLDLHGQHVFSHGTCPCCGNPQCDCNLDNPALYHLAMRVAT
jgi:hypothetical protein